MQVFHAAQPTVPLPPGHRFPMDKYRLLHDALVRQVPPLRLAAAPPATDGELALAHEPSYIAAVSDGSIDPRAMREIGFPWSPAVVQRARGSVGATVMACRAALVDGVAAHLAGGTHHAARDKGGGFCIFNDAAVAARLMQAQRLREQPQPLQVAVIDLDVHQGNGTAAIFRGDPSVFTLSLHGQKNFPFRKEASDLDVELPDGCRDGPYLEALEHALQELESRFHPGLVIYLAGADPHEGDRLGRLALSTDGLEARDRRVFEWAWQRRIPLAMAMAGGYGRCIEDTVQIQLTSFRVAQSYWQRWQNLQR